jgi:monofunctional glycosyltransferase
MASRKQNSDKPARRGRKRKSATSASIIDAELDHVAEEDAGPSLRRRRSFLSWVFRWVRLALFGLFGLMIAHLVIFAFVPPVSMLMLERWISGEPVKRSYVSLDEISPRLIASVIASEDSQFCRHWGVDFNAVWDVLEQAWDADEAPTRGASTITMQVTKNLYLWHLPSYARKVLEAPMSLVLDMVWSKQRIMEVYLNIAEWGPNGVIGAEEGAKRAFGKSAKSLTSRQAALLTTSLPNPIKRNSARPSRRQALVASLVEQRARSAELPLECFADEYRPR